MNWAGLRYQRFFWGARWKPTSRLSKGSRCPAEHKDNRWAAVPCSPGYRWRIGSRLAVRCSTVRCSTSVSSGGTGPWWAQSGLPSALCCRRLASSCCGFCCSSCSTASAPSGCCRNSSMATCCLAGVWAWARWFDLAPETFTLFEAAGRAWPSHRSFSRCWTNRSCHASKKT